jgi:hypothetical protein
MKKIFFLSIILLSTFYSSQEIDARLSEFLVDTNIRLKTINILDFIKSSTTIHLNDYQSTFITLDADDLKYVKNTKVGSVNGDGIFSLHVSNQMLFDKNAKKLYCYEINPNTKYLIVRVNEKFNDENYLIKKEKQCDCNKLFSINQNTPTSPQSMFSYSMNNGIPLLYNAASFDALEFLRIEFLVN